MARPRSETARTKMLEAASTLILAVGVSGFTVEEVARRSGVAKTTIYRHFPHKNDLLVAALDGALAVPATPDTGSLRGDLLEYLASVRPIFADEQVRAASLDILAAAAKDAALHEIHLSMVSRRSRPLRIVLDRARRRGEISPEIDHATAFEAIEGPFIVRSLIRPEALDQIDLEALVDRVLLMFRPHDED